MKHGRARAQQRGVGVGVGGRVGRALGEREIPGLLDEARELRDRDRPAVDREGGDLDLAHGRLFGVEVGRAHPEAPGR